MFSKKVLFFILALILYLYRINFSFNSYILKDYFNWILPTWNFTWQIDVADLLNWNNGTTWCTSDVTIYDSDWNKSTDNYTWYCYSSWTYNDLFIPYSGESIDFNKIYVINRNCWNHDCAKEIIRKKIIRIKLWQLIWNICYDNGNDKFISCN